MGLQNIYKQQSVATAPSGKLLIMLFDGLLRFMSQARVTMEQRNVEETHNNLCRAQDIVLELRATLDHEKAPELCQELHDLYTFFYTTLIDANRLKSVEKIDDIYGFVQELRNAFEQAHSIALQERE